MMLDSIGRVMVRINEISNKFNNSSISFSKAGDSGNVSKVLNPESQRSGSNNQVSESSAFYEALINAQNANLTAGTNNLSGKGGASRYDQIIKETAGRYNIDPALVKAVMMAESGGNANARSSAGALGLMQLMPSTARGLGVNNPLDPIENIEGGTKYLKRMVDEFGDIKLALAAYNAGPGAVKRYGGVPPYKETQRYIVKVLDLYSKYSDG